MKENTIPEDLLGRLRQEYTHFDAELYPKVSEFVDYLKGLGVESPILAIIFYGSCLNPGMQKSTSTPDYYVVVQSYRQFFSVYFKSLRRSLFHSLLCWSLPPSIYRYGESKFSVISLADLERETSSKAKDVYNLGRFSKRMMVAYARDKEAGEAVILQCAKAMRQALLFALPLVKDRFSFNDVLYATLNLSYLGEPRVEAGDKVQKIIASQRTLYEYCYQSLLDSLCNDFEWLTRVSSTAASTELNYEQRVSVRRKARSIRFVRFSRLRALMRWPKFVFTVENWPDYMAAKIARTKGLHIELKERERRYPVIYCWKYLWMLRKKKLLK